MTSWRFGNRSDVGLVRDGNEDASYAGARLLVVADGVGGSVAGEIASNIAITALAPLDRDDNITDPQQALRDATRKANRELRSAIQADPSLAGMGTTLTALLWSGDTLALAQLGDSRGYLLRDGVLTQITRDQTLVQSLVDEGQITPEEALTHPRRSWILRALDGRDESDPDVELLTVQPGDRYLLCSDGLSDYVDADAIAEALGQGEPQQASESLVDLALRAGAPDNVTCVVADPVDAPPSDPQPLLGGAATATPRIPTAADAPVAAEPAATDIGRHAVERDRRRIGARLAIVAGIVVVLIVGAIVGTLVYIHHQWYVGQSAGKVTIYQGVKGKALGYDLSHVHQVTDLPATALPYDDQSNVRNGIGTSGGVAGAQREVETLRSDACALAASRTPSPSPSTLTGQRHKHHLRKPTPRPTPTLPSWCPTPSGSPTP
jgi:protein phosphatase